MPRFFVDVADRVFDLVADEAMTEKRDVRAQAAILIEQALGLRPRREGHEQARQRAEAAAS